MNTPAYFAMDNFGGSVVSISENQNQNSVYPNPTNGVLNIDLIENSNLSLFNINGQLIKSNYSGNTFLKWDISNLENGIYFLVIENSGTTTTQKIVKK